jgi:hypothetical protein
MAGMTMNNLTVSLVPVVVVACLLTGEKIKGAIRGSRGVALLILAVALLLGRRVVLDGTARGLASTALVSLALAGRRVDVGLHEFRTGRVYWRVAVEA